MNIWLIWKHYHLFLAKACCCSVAQSCLLFICPGKQHTRLPCPSPFPGACSNSYPLSQWCHPTVSSSGVPFSSCPQSFPASGSFPVSHFFAVGGQIVGASAFSISPSSEYSGLISFITDWFVLLAIHGTLKSLLQHHSSKAAGFFFFFWSGSHIHTCLLEKTQFWLYRPLLAK